MRAAQSSIRHLRLPSCLSSVVREREKALARSTYPVLRRSFTQSTRSNKPSALIQQSQWLNNGVLLRLQSSLSAQVRYASTNASEVVPKKEEKKSTEEEGKSEEKKDEPSDGKNGEKKGEENDKTPPPPPPSHGDKSSFVKKSKEAYSTAVEVTSNVVLKTRLRRETKVPYSTIDKAFEELRKEGQTPAQAILNLLNRFKLLDLKYFTEKINCSFSSVTYEEIAPLFGLEPDNEARDMHKLTLHRSRLPTPYIREILKTLRVKGRVLGPMSEHDNENARVRYLDGLIDWVVDLFGETIRNKPEQRLIGTVTKDGSIEYQFVAFSTIIVVFMVVKRTDLEGKNLRKSIAQIMAESDACDAYNEKYGYWLPIRGILTNGERMFFFEFRSDTRTWMKSELYDGLSVNPASRGFVGVRRMSELLFDFLLLGYIDGLEARHLKSVIKSRRQNAGGISIQGEPSTQWMASLEDAREALKLARQSHEMIVAFDDSKNKGFFYDKDDQKEIAFKANALACDALEHLKKSIANAPTHITPTSDEYDETKLEFDL